MHWPILEDGKIREDHAAIARPSRPTMRIWKIDKRVKETIRESEE